MAKEENSLEDKKLIYSFKLTNGNAHKDGRSGAGGAELKLYNDGTVVRSTYFAEMGPTPRKPEYKSEENKLDSPHVSKVIDLIKSSGIMEKECPQDQRYDVIYRYTINLNGTKKDLTNPYGDCWEILKKIDQMLDPKQ